MNGTDKPSKAEAVVGAPEGAKTRTSLRQQGLRPVTRWVPDTRDPRFIEQYRVGMALLAKGPEEEDFWEWMDAVRCTEGWV